jgi:K+-transporting ATPase ATPase A chain
MTLNGWIQISLLLVLVVATARPLGLYMAAVYDRRSTFLDPLARPLEHRLYGLAGIYGAGEQGWFAYLQALLAFNAAGFVLL